MTHIQFYIEQIAQFRSGDESAFSRVWDRIYGLVIKQIKGSLPALHFNSSSFKDLVQNCRLAIWNSMRPGKWDEAKNRKFTTYAMQSIRFMIIDTVTSEVKYYDRHRSLSNFTSGSEDDSREEEAFYNQINESEVWSWIPSSDSEVIYKDMTREICKQLTGVSLVLFLLKGVGNCDSDIRRQMQLSFSEYNKRLELLRWRVSYILNEFGYDLT